MVVETRTVSFRIDPALNAYFEWINANGKKFSLTKFEQFAADYRARVAEEATPPTPSSGAQTESSDGQ